MARGADLGAALGVRIAMIGSRVRETSLARTTPALVQMASQVADAQAAKRAEAVRRELVSWLRSHGVEVPEGGELTGLLGAVGKVGGWLAQNVIGTAIGFGVGQALSAVLNPYFVRLVQDAWRSNPNQVLTPAELAQAVIRGYLDAGTAQDEAAASGIDPQRFGLMLRLAMQPPPLGEALRLWRRGWISEDDLIDVARRQNVTETDLELLRRATTEWPSWGEILDGYLEGQISEADARDLFERAGGDPDLFDFLFRTRGQAPTPPQLLDLLNRGIIPERGTGPDAVSYEQGFLEGPWRNKWLEPFLALREYVIPPRSVVPLLRSGAITRERAIELLAKSGVTREDAEAMTAEAASGKLAPEKDLVKTEVVAAYREGLLRREEAAASLEQLGYEPDEADLILAIADHAWERSYRDAAANRIRTLYVKGSITEDEASAALAQLGITGEALSKRLALWDIERELPRAELTLAQMQTAVRRGIVSEDRFREWLRLKGYDAEEIEILVALTGPAA
jgi:hypothetical protein